ncbi:hypothetical protein CW745_16075 [Psychromonas sp. psych-6C06]|uniref:hypothetical protein n=1 Tax=Psychromonas sp. psych-6C06 TaxID=2058089 RepID=UPI000C3238B2|nr:hypothetical protein [Psychromonas sp. psych-6C06]PKF60234.1 hypothetical protein CW745_16075 [Psychromonas sp. psych-6C06]
MKVYRKVKQTKFVKDGLKGLLTIHDHGGIAVSIDHKSLFVGLTYEETDSYLYIDKPSTKDKTMIMDRLFDSKT